MTEAIERRTLETHELRAAESHDGARVLTGYAAKFNALSEFIGEFREEIAPGAFAAVMGGDVRALFNHDANMVLGRTTNGTLRLSEDETGLRVEVSLPDTRYADDLWTLVQRGDISQMSFGFTVGASGQTWRKQAGTPIRRITKVNRLLDVSAVTYPAYQQTSIQARDIEAALAGLDADNNEVDALKRVDDTDAVTVLPTQTAKRNRTLRILEATR
jgi:HK97 family phage prohead protease